MQSSSESRYRLRTGRCVVSSVLLTLLAATLTSCGLVTGSPKITEFEAQPAKVSPGEQVTLRWAVQNIEGGRLLLHKVTADGESVQLGDFSSTEQSSTVDKVEETTTYRLTATGPSGTTSREIGVSVEGGDSGAGGGSGGGGSEPPMCPAPSNVASASSSRNQDAEPLSSSVPLSQADFTQQQSGDCNCLLFLIAGQSNAVGYGEEKSGSFPSGSESSHPNVHMLRPGNSSEWQWETAKEPIHEGAKHSFALRFGKEVHAAVGKDVYLVPAADGGSSLAEWQPGQGSDSLFETAVNKAEWAAGNLGTGVSAVLWYQGESDTKSNSDRRDFIQETDDVFQAFRQQLTGAPEVIYVQLSKRLFHGTEPGNNIEGHNLAYQVVREKQRLMEDGANEVEVGSSGESSDDRAYYHMVVAHDLPMSDLKHVSAEGQRYLGQRLAHVYLNQVLTDGDIQGPRLESITMAGKCTLYVDTTKAINDSSNYDDYFTVFADGDAMEHRSIGKDPADPTRIRIDMEVELNGNVEVRYMPPAEVDLHTWSNNAVHTTVNGNLKLALPAFNGPVEPLPHDWFPGARMGDG